MILFIISITAYLGALLFIKPAPGSLKATPLTIAENFKRVRGSLFSGALILLVFWITSNFGFKTVNAHLYATLCLNNIRESAVLWPLQSFTHLFIHGNLVHLLTNVSGLGLASVYERRVGTRRFISVLLVGSAASIPSILFYSETAFVCGISGGVFGLAAAYFTDEDELTLKEWGTAILLFTALALMLGLKHNPHEEPGGRVDHMGHAMGAIGAIAYCRLTSKRLKITSHG